jgi:hypothetical protein
MSGKKLRPISPKDKHQYGIFYFYYLIFLESMYRNSFHGKDILEGVKNKKRVVREIMSKLDMSIQ